MLRKTRQMYLYLGPRDLLLKEPQPAEVFLDKDYMAEVQRRAAITGGGPMADRANPDKISGDYNPFFYDPNEMQKMMGSQKKDGGIPKDDDVRAGAVAEIS